jgi:hypothetical protein
MGYKLHVITETIKAYGGELIYGFTQPSNPHYMVIDDKPHDLAALILGKE